MSEKTRAAATGAFAQGSGPEVKGTKLGYIALNDASAGKGMSRRDLLKSAYATATTAALMSAVDAAYIRSRQRVIEFLYARHRAPSLQAAE